MRAFLTALMVCTALPAYALDAPKPGDADPHIRQVSYNPLNRTKLVGQVGRQTTITFCKGEQVARIVLGQGDAAENELWSGPSDEKMNAQPLQNNLPLWPIKIDATNLQVTTVLPDQTQRIYQFALSAKPAGNTDDPDAVYGLIFQCPQEVQAAKAAVWRETQAKRKKEQIAEKLAVDIFYGNRNWKYTGVANKAWRESGWPRPEVSDNGMVTAFSFKGMVPSPAIYIVDQPKCTSEGNEQLAPWSAQGDLKIIPSIAQHFRLRLGNAVMEVCNEGWNSVGSDPGTGTTSPEIIREVRMAR